MLPKFSNGVGPMMSSSALPKAMIAIFTLTALYHLQYLMQLPKDIKVRVTPTSGPLAADPHNRAFISYGPENCFPSFSATLQDFATTRNRSCSEFAPFTLTETYRTAFATASTGGALSLAYERGIQSQMTHSIIHNTTVHMMCAELRSGVWNKIAFLHSLVSNELLKPASERRDWILWADRDSLILDQCRPLSSFLPPKTPEYDTVDLIVNHDFNGLNAGIFFFRPNHWVLDFFNLILAYPYYRPGEKLAFAEQTAMERIIASSPAFSSHTARVPWHWFNTYPPDDGNTASFGNGTASEGVAWSHARKGDFLVHFAGRASRETEMLDWSDALEKAGNVWADKEGTRDVTKDIENYWRAWKDGSLTEGMMNGYS